MHVGGGLEPETVRKYLREHEVAYPIGLDVSNDATRAYGISSIPHAFVIDRGGRIAWDGSPLSDGFDRAVERVLATGG